jgi:hypothetical protein
MLTDKEKRLIYLATVVTVICVSGLFLFLRVADLFAINKAIATDEANIKKQSLDLTDADTLEERIKAAGEKIVYEKNKFYKPEEIDIASFSLRVKDTIRQSGLKEQSYKTVETNKTVMLEFQASGTSYNLAKFLEAVSKSEKYWTISEMNVKLARAGRGNVDITLRIAYETNSQVSK